MKTYIIKVQGSDGEIHSLMIREGAFVSLPSDQKVLRIEGEKGLPDDVGKEAQGQYQDGKTHTLTIYSDKAVAIAKVFVPNPEIPISVSKMPAGLPEEFTPIVQPLLENVKALFKYVPTLPSEVVEQAVRYVSEDQYLQGELSQADVRSTLGEKVEDLITTVEVTRFEIDTSEFGGIEKAPVEREEIREIKPDYFENQDYTHQLEEVFQLSQVVESAPVNDAPVITVPGAQSVVEDIALIFNSVNNNLISIADPDAGTNPVEVTLSATNGVLTLSQTAGLTFTTGTGSGDASMVFNGSLDDINAALDGMSFIGLLNFNGDASIAIDINDEGHSGEGGPLTDSETIDVTVTAFNDAPINTVPGQQAVDVGLDLIFNTANGNAISISDVDAGTDPVQVTLTATNGLMTLAGTAGLTFTTGDGTGDATMVFTGTIADINTALNGMIFVGGVVGDASIEVATNDLGNNGAGGAMSDTDVIDIDVVLFGGFAPLGGGLPGEDNIGDVIFTDNNDADVMIANQAGWDNNDGNEQSGDISANSGSDGSDFLVDPDNSNSNDLF